MSRILLLAAIAAVVYWLIASRRRQPSATADGNGAEDTVRCAHCGIYLPKKEGMLVDGRYFCSEAHCRAFTEMSHGE